MMESLRSATRNTGFEAWLDATLRPQAQADPPALLDDSPKACHTCSFVLTITACLSTYNLMQCNLFAFISFVATKFLWGGDVLLQ